MDADVISRIRSQAFSSQYSKTIAEMVDANQLSYDLFLAHSSSSISVTSTSDFISISSELAAPQFQGVRETQVSATRLEQLMNEQVEYHQERLQPFIWRIWSSSQPSDLAHRLENHGFRSLGEKPTMALDLTAHSFELEGIDEMSVIPVTSQAELNLWVETLLQGFEMKGVQRDNYRQMFSSVGFLSPCRYYLAYYQGRPVATALRYGYKLTAGLYWVSTEPDFRGQGIAKQLVKRVLHDARVDGYHWAVLQASQMGLPLYESIGFRVCGGNTHYAWLFDSN